MELSEMNLEQVETRIKELDEEVRNASDKETVEKATEELKSLNVRKNELHDLEARKNDAKAIMEGSASVKTIEERKGEKTMMKMAEFRNTKAYIDAYAEYLKTEDDKELRALLTENVEDGTIAVPEFVYEIVKTAWDSNDILARVTKTELPGNLKVNFEISGGDATVHTEGGTAVTEEELVEGIATLIPASVKKWVAVSDEAMDMRGEAFLRYIYNELAYRITKKIADRLVGQIAALPSVATETSPNAAAITAAPAMGTVAAGIANLSDEAANPVIIMNKLTWSEFKSVQYANGYGADPFEGLPVLFNNTLPAYSAASATNVYMIIGDLGHGAIANFPNGEEIKFKFDELSRKKEDLVEVLGREYVATGVVACKAFTLVKKPSVG